MEALFVIVLIAAVVGVAVFAIQAYNRKIEEAWAAAATRLGMTFRAGSMFKSKAISGSKYDNRVEVDTFTQSSGKSSTTYTRYRVYYPEPLGLGLKLTQQGFFTEVASFFGAQDIEVGDASFDREVLVKGADPARVAEFLTPSRRLRIVRLFQTFSKVEIADHAITWSSRGTAAEPEKIVSTVRRLAFAAARIQAGTDPERALDQAIEAQREGRLDDALEHVRQTPTTERVTDPDARLLEGQILETAGRRDEAATVFENASRESPEDEELGEWARRAESAAAPAPVAAPPLEAAAVCEDLFAANVSTLEAKKRFDTHYDERLVRWSGTLRQASTYYIDLVFGSTPGTKLVLDVHELTVGPFGRTAQAIVQLPREALEALRSRVGERLEFEGRLVSCDALMRNLFIADGNVL